MDAPIVANGLDDRAARAGQGYRAGTASLTGHGEDACGRQRFGLCLDCIPQGRGRRNRCQGVNADLIRCLGCALVAGSVNDIGRIGVTVPLRCSRVREVPGRGAGMDTLGRGNGHRWRTVFASLQTDVFAVAKSGLQRADNQRTGVIGYAAVGDITRQETGIVREGLNSGLVSGRGSINGEPGKVVAGIHAACRTGAAGDRHGITVLAAIHPNGTGRHRKGDIAGRRIICGCANRYICVAGVLQHNANVACLQCTEDAAGGDHRRVYRHRRLRFLVVDHVILSNKSRLDRDVGRRKVPTRRLVATETGKGIAVHILEAARIKRNVVVRSRRQPRTRNDENIRPIHLHLAGTCNVYRFDQRTVECVQLDAATANDNALGKNHVELGFAIRTIGDVVTAIRGDKLADRRCKHVCRTEKLSPNSHIASGVNGLNTDHATGGLHGADFGRRQQIVPFAIRRNRQQMPAAAVDHQRHA